MNIRWPEAGGTATTLQPLNGKITADLVNNM